MADDVRDGAGNVIVRGDRAGNRGMDPQTPLYTTPGSAAPGVTAASSPAVNSGTATTDAPGTLVAATPAVLLAANAARQLLVITNTGANPMQVRFGANPTAVAGHTIAPGATLVLDTKTPTGSVNGFSTTGTTWFATQG
jgi:hypothetical protein